MQQYLYITTYDPLEEPAYQPDYPFRGFFGAYLVYIVFFHSDLQLALEDPYLGTLLPNTLDKSFFDRGFTESNQVRSMLRLVDYCEYTNGNNRNFLGGLLAIIHEEVTENGFDLSQAWSRDRLLNHVKKHYY